MRLVESVELHQDYGVLLHTSRKHVILTRSWKCHVQRFLLANTQKSDGKKWKNSGLTDTISKTQTTRRQSGLTQMMTMYTNYEIKYTIKNCSYVSDIVTFRNDRIIIATRFKNILFSEKRAIECVFISVWITSSAFIAHVYVQYKHNCTRRKRNIDVYIAINRLEFTAPNSALYTLRNDKG